MSNGKRKRKGRGRGPFGDGRETLAALAASTAIYVDERGSLRTERERRALTASVGVGAGDWQRLVPTDEGRRVLARRRLQNAVKADARAKLSRSLAAVVPPARPPKASASQSPTLAGKGWYGKRR